ncbi:hypothetical protein OG612_33255 [Streptomyces sp. NBC_01527]|uniref:hypothetical protein n=1 Tax=Streptomyces sp. NBC_01527 TaxID=2903894 RepID=UPI0038701EDB
MATVEAAPVGTTYDADDSAAGRSARPRRNPWRAHDDSYGTSLRRRNTGIRPAR